MAELKHKTKNTMNTIDTRDLIETRNDLKQTILDAYNDEFETDFSDFDEINVSLLGEDLGEIDYTEEEIEKLNNFKELYSEELKEVEEINDLEEEINNSGSNSFDDGVYLVDEDDFEEYAEEELEQCGYFDKDFPQWIKNNIDWKGIASDMKQYYLEIDYQGTTYLYR